jgi:hypothetical protein
MSHDVHDNEISEVTRRSIIDYLSTANLNWSGRLRDDEFLARLYDLSEMRSCDYRYNNAAIDIYQHRVNNDDWNDDWVFYDSRFNLLHAPDHVFTRFLCETLHPTVRASETDARGMARVYNKALAADGWQLVEGTPISGRPTFIANSTYRTTVFEEPTGWQKVDRQLQEMRLRLSSADTEEQCQSVGLLCREILISVEANVRNDLRHRVEGV